METSRFTKKIIGFFTFTALLLLSAISAFSHCEIPCGIYNDELRFTMIAEDITTLEKSMNEITKLSAEKEKNYNQIVRWVQNKEDHANRIMNVVTQYFMTQRLKPVEKDDAKAYNKYVDQLILLHEMLIYAMKAKQTTDLSNVEMLRSLLAQFKSAYLA